MKYINLLIVALFLLSGCSHSNGIIEPDLMSLPANRDGAENHRNWGIWTFFISPDHQSIEVVPARGANYHYCVTKFMEI